MTTIIERGTKLRGQAQSFDLSTIEAYEVTSAVPTSWSTRYDLRKGDRILVDWSRRPDIGWIGAVRDGDGAVRFVPFDGDESATIGCLVSPAILLEV